MEPVEPVQMNIYQGNTYNRDLNWLQSVILVNLSTEKAYSRSVYYFLFQFGPCTISDKRFTNLLIKKKMNKESAIISVSLLFISKVHFCFSSGRHCTKSWMFVYSCPKVPCLEKIEKSEIITLSYESIP